jgi:hypothetical protein
VLSAARIGLDKEATPPEMQSSWLGVSEGPITCVELRKNLGESRVGDGLRYTFVAATYSFSHEQLADLDSLGLPHKDVPFLLQAAGSTHSA